MINIINIQVTYDIKNHIEILYGLDNHGVVYWYRQWTDETRTEGWVPLVMSTSEEIIKDEQSTESKS